MDLLSIFPSFPRVPRISSVSLAFPRDSCFSSEASKGASKWLWMGLDSINERQIDSTPNQRLQLIVWCCKNSSRTFSVSCVLITVFCFLWLPPRETPHRQPVDTVRMGVVTHVLLPLHPVFCCFFFFCGPRGDAVLVTGAPDKKSSTGNEKKHQLRVSITLKLLLTSTPHQIHLLLPLLPLVTCPRGDNKKRRLLTT